MHAGGSLVGSDKPSAFKEWSAIATKVSQKKPEWSSLHV